MTVEVNCPHCEASYEIEQYPGGDDTRCEQCGNSLSNESFIEATQLYTPGLETNFKTQGNTHSDNIPAVIGRFQVRDLLGTGAFGSVYRAYDPLLDREVALKVPHAGEAKSEMDRARSLREPKAAAQLRHPNIVPIHDVVIDDDNFYIASAYIEGQTLQEAFENKRPGLQRTAEIVLKLADALDYAHQQGIVHRDVKPANIMLDTKDEPLVMDFGLARIQENPETHESAAHDSVSNESEIYDPETSGPIEITPNPTTANDGDTELATREGTIMGTAAFMAPEQAAGKQEEIGPASDQYSLGIVLYELLCGQLPFTGPYSLVISLVQNQQPISPKKYNNSIPADLEAICLKTIAKRPAERYACCRALADDLRRWMDDIPVLARPLGLVERAGRWCKRNPAIASLTVAVLLVFLIGFSLTAWQWQEAATSAKSEREANRKLEKKNTELDAATKEAELQADNAKKQTAIAIENETKAQAATTRAEANAALAKEKAALAVEKEDEKNRRLYAANMNLALDAWNKTHVRRLRELLDFHLPQPGEPDLRGFEWYYLDRLCRADRMTMKGHRGGGHQHR